MSSGPDLGRVRVPHNLAMKRYVCVSAALLLVLSSGCSKSGDASSSASPAYKNIVLTDDESSKTPKTTFSKDTPRIFVFFGLEGVSVGTKVKSIWICEKSEVAEPNYKIDEVTLTVVPPMNEGNFSLSKPNAGWPEGSYRVDMYMDGAVTDTVKFTVGPPK